MDKLQLKRYTIREKLGEGGMADVYLAYDNVLKRDCAIKIMKSELSTDPVATIRFRREADAAANLQHPNIVSIYDVGESNNRPFIVMEYVFGQTLKELIQQRGAIEKREAISIATQIAEGLKVAHEAGVVHRDVKPHNILVKSDGTAKITDFGIASVQGSIQLTQHDSVMGSVHYLAPECSRGEQASIQSDLYSLGIVLYEMLTGDLPYKGDAAVQVAMKHMQEEIPSVRSVNNSIEQSIDNIIIKATSKNKATRYRSAQEMLDDLKVALSPEHAHDPKLVLSSGLVGSNEETLVLSDISTIKDEKDPMTLRNKILLGVIGAATLGLIILLASTFLFNNKGEDKAYFELLDVSNMTLEEATEKLEELELVIKDNHIYETSKEFEKDKIIKSSPVAKTLVKKGDEISFTISIGEAFEVEDYTGLTLQDVRNKLGNIEFINLIVEYEKTIEYKENTVIRQEGLQPGDEIDPTKKYNLFIVVAEPMVFQLPDVRGENYLEAERILKDMGVEVQFSAQDSETLSDSDWAKTEFEVITKMSPSAGTSYNTSSGTVVVLTYWTPSDRVSVDKEALIQRVAEAQQIDTTGKTTESINNLDLAIQNANNVISNEKATQESVDNALVTLNRSIEMLKDVVQETPATPIVHVVTSQDLVVTGQSEPNYTIRITNATGVEIGLGRTNADGSFEISIPQQEVGTYITIVATNEDGASSVPVPVMVVSAE